MEILLYGAFALFAFVLGAGVYVVQAIFTMKLFKKAGAEAWKAWIPIVAQWKLLQLGGFKGWLSLFALAPLAVFIIGLLVGLVYRNSVMFSGMGFAINTILLILTIIGWLGVVFTYVLTCIAVSNINKKLSKDTAMVVLYIFLPIVWMGICGLDKSKWNDSKGKVSSKALIALSDQKLVASSTKGAKSSKGEKAAPSVPIGERIKNLPAKTKKIAIIVAAAVVLVAVGTPVGLTIKRDIDFDNCVINAYQRQIKSANTGADNDGYYRIWVQGNFPTDQAPTSVLIDGVETDKVNNFETEETWDSWTECHLIKDGDAVQAYEFSFDIDSLTCEEKVITIKGDGFERSSDIYNSSCKTNKQVDEEKAAEKARQEKEEAERKAKLAEMNPWNGITASYQSETFSGSGYEGRLSWRIWPGQKSRTTSMIHPGWGSDSSSAVIPASSTTSLIIPFQISVTNLTSGDWKPTLYRAVNASSGSTFSLYMECESGAGYTRISGSSGGCQITNAKYFSIISSYGYIVIDKFFTPEYPNGTPVDKFGYSITRMFSILGKVDNTMLSKTVQATATPNGVVYLWQ